MEITAGNWFIAWFSLVAGALFIYMMYKIMTASREDINGKSKK